MRRNDYLAIAAVCLILGLFLLAASLGAQVLG